MDNQTEFRRNLQQIFRALPEPVRIAMYAPETIDVYDALEQKFHLTNTQREELSVQTGLLLMGLRNPQDLVSALTRELSIERNTALLIAQDLNRDIFARIKDELKSLHAPTVAESVKAAPQPTIHPAPIAPAFSLEKAMGKPAQPTVSAPVSSQASVPPPAPIPPRSSVASPEQSMPKPHIGNIFEEKLGGAFRVKSDEVEYSAPATEKPLPPTPPVPPATQQRTSAPLIPPPSPAQGAVKPTIPSLVSPPVMPPTPPIAAPLTPPSPVIPPPPIPPPPPSSSGQKGSDPYRELPV